MNKAIVTGASSASEKLYAGSLQRMAGWFTE